MEPSPVRDISALHDEQQRMRRLRILVDLTTAVIRHRPPSRGEAEQMVAHLREQVLALFPDKGSVFDLIYRPRFRRLIDESCGARESATGSAAQRGCEP